MDEFILIQHQKQHAYVRKAKQQVVAAALFEGLGCERIESDGRGALERFRYGGGYGLVRKYRHGGLIRFAVPEDLFLSNRARNENVVHQYLLSNGVRLPGLLGVTWSKRGPFYQGAIATVELEGMHLGRYLETNTEPDASVLKACGALIRQMHDLHVWHADLQLRNILIRDTTPYLLDFDKAQIREEMSLSARAANLLRLRRSILKNGFSEEIFACICRGYGKLRFPLWLETYYEAKARVSDMISGRKNS